MAKFTTRRFIGNPVRIVGRHPSDYAQELQEFTERIVENITGAIPAGFNDLLPHPIVANAGNAGTEDAGWAAADHEHDGRHPLLDGALDQDTTAQSPTDGAVIRGNGTKWTKAATVSIFDTVAADDSTNFLMLTGVLPAVPTAVVMGARIRVTGAGSAAFQQIALQVNLEDGYTGAAVTRGLHVQNLTVNSSGKAIGIHGYSQNGGGSSYGGLFTSPFFTTNESVGIAGQGGYPVHNVSIGGVFYLADSGGGGLPALESAVVLMDSANSGSLAALLVAKEAGNLRFKLDPRGRIVTAGTAPTPTVTGFGGAGLVVAADTGSNDTCGTITVTAGAAPAAAGTIVLTFANVGFGTNTVSPHATPMDGTGAWNAQVSLRITAKSTAAVTFAWDNSGAALVAGNTYKFAYVVVSH